MLSLFPSLLAFEQLAPFLLRLTLGAVLIFWAYGKIKARSDWKPTTLGLIEAVAGLLLIVGFMTQLGALVALIILAVKLIKKLQTRSLFTNGVNYYFILFVISLSLLFMGPGAFAIDLPL